ncbi:HalOD1 output domain-containing protein [Halorientalis salina]|uniref:HalOD1 output domain-containing protein n=1 Tax=Halorientalis salina TaxID=2932266 RepID=UPI0010AD3573|nr:HalOD1 output domain-containing protein [Halorientalis salina]
MSAEDGELYILRPDDDAETDDEEAWVSPQPASDVVMEEVASAVDADPDDFASLEEYVDLADLVEVFEGDERSLTFEVDDHEVTVTDAGEVDVDQD